LNGIQEVSGSIPLISTTGKSREALKNQCFPAFLLSSAKCRKGIKRIAIIKAVIKRF